jgi:hypothetical protein
MRGGNHHLLAVILTLRGFTGQSQFRLEHMSYIRQTKILLKHQQKIRKQRRKQTFDHGVTRHLQRHQACIRRGQFRCALLATFQRGKLPFRRRGIKQIHHVRGRVAGFTAEAEGAFIVPPFFAKDGSEVVRAAEAFFCQHSGQKTEPPSPWQQISWKASVASSAALLAQMFCHLSGTKPSAFSHPHLL